MKQDWWGGFCYALIITEGAIWQKDHLQFSEDNLRLCIRKRPDEESEFRSRGKSVKLPFDEKIETLGRSEDKVSGSDIWELVRLSLEVPFDLLDL
jgi:hypothetical protein